MANVFEAVGDAVGAAAGGAAGGVASVVTTGLSAIDSLIGRWKANPTDVMKHEEAAQLVEQAREQARLTFELQSIQTQTRINELEAASADRFTSRPRPAAMWVCVASMAYSVIRPFLVMACVAWGIAPPPELNTATQDTMLYALLGIGAYRSFDKMKGTSK